MLYETGTEHGVSPALIWGAVATIVVMLVCMAWMLTDNTDPVRRRAKRLGVLAGIIVGLFPPCLLLMSYDWLGRMVGDFLLIPSVAVMPVTGWWTGAWVWRRLGGEQRREGMTDTIREK